MYQQTDQSTHSVEAAAKAPKFGKLAWSGIIIGIVGVVGSIIPILNNLTAMAAVVGLILAAIGLFGSRKIAATIGIVLCILAMVFTVLAQNAFVKDLDKSLNDVGSGTQVTHTSVA